MYSYTRQVLNRCSTGYMHIEKSEQSARFSIDHFPNNYYMSTMSTINTINTINTIDSINTIVCTKPSNAVSLAQPALTGAHANTLSVMSTAQTNSSVAVMSAVGTLSPFSSLHSAAPPGVQIAGGVESRGTVTENEEPSYANLWQGTMSNVATHLYRSFGYATSHDRADALHNAILRLLSLQAKSGIHLHEEELRKWLHCVASRMLLDARRMQLRTTVFSDLGSSETIPESELDLDDDFFEELPTQHSLDISYALQRLSPSLRACFELHSQGFSAEEVACTLGLGRDAVHKRIQRARRELQMNLKEYL